MAITFTGVRATPNLTVPSTQNTAPVLDFRCLYTYDLRRKAKRWQDGVLRFHTFNKRVMVYDVPRNYIGDTHWRGDSTVQDGDELQLDKGVLIQVGEATGSTDQDLTELLEKRRKAPEVAVDGPVSPQARPVASNAVRPAAAQPSQLRPKSLNALLGTPQGRTGRASLPVKSPYEVRTLNESTSFPDNRPAKRQRVEPQPEQRGRSNTSPKVRAPIPSKTPNEGESPKTATNPMPEKSVEISPLTSCVGKSNPPPPQFDHVSRSTSSRGEQRNQQKTSKRTNATSPKKQPDRLQEANVTEATKMGRIDSGTELRSKAKEALPSRRDKGPQKSLETNPDSPAIRDASKLTKVAKEPIEIVPSGNTPSTHEPSKERMKLQMATRKPRRKLMSMDLLPQNPSAASRSPNVDNIVRQGRRGSSLSTKAVRQPKNPLSEAHREEQDRLKARLDKLYAKDSHAIRDHVILIEDDPGSPDLFVSQFEDDALPTSHHKTKEKASNTLKTTSESQVTGDFFNQTRPPSTDPPELSIPKAISTVHDTALALAEMDEILLSHQQPASKSRSSTPKQAPCDSPTHRIPPTPRTPRDRIPRIFDSSLPPLKDTTPQPPALQIQATQPDAVTHAKSPSISPSKDSPPLSPGVQIQARPPPPPSKALLPDQPISKLDPDPHVPPIQRPFKPPRPRSPLRKAISDTTAMRPPPPLQAQQDSKAVAANQTSSLWSKEAWDLFGCGRDGVECTYDEFKRKEGLMWKFERCVKG